MAWTSIEISYSVFTRIRYRWLLLHLFHKLNLMTVSNNVLIVDENNSTRIIRWEKNTAYATSRSSHALFHLNLSDLQNIIILSFRPLFNLPFDAMGTPSAMPTRWSIANIKHSLVIVFSIAFSCLLSNIPLRLSDFILLRLPANPDCFSTKTKNLL